MQVVLKDREDLDSQARLIPNQKQWEQVNENKCIHYSYPAEYQK